MQESYQLYDYQRPNVEETKKIFGSHPICFNLSKMGLGKSIIALEVSRTFKNVIVISYPNVIEQNWRGVLKRFNRSEIELLTINILRGMKNSHLSHSYLIREDLPLQQPTFTTTNKWIELCEEGILVIIDEVQLCKNDNIGTSALRELLCPIVSDYINTNGEYIGRSRVLMMSGTPIDEYKQIMNYFSIIGFGTTPAEICIRLGAPDNTDVRELFKTYFLPYYSSSMIEPQRTIQFRGYYYKYNVNIVNISKTYCKKQLKEIEIAKTQIFCDLTKELLEQYDKHKIVVGLFFRDSIAKLTKMLEIYNPGVIYGDVSRFERRRIINLFQKPTTEMRLLIANVDIINTGINLDDEDGNYPRICLVNIGYMPPHQLSHRFNRANTKSNSELRIILCREINEISMLESQHRKSNVMADFAESIYPNNYDIVEC